MEHINAFGDNKTDLYRDNRLSSFQRSSGPKSKQIKKKLCKIFKQKRFNITLESNLAITDLTFDLQTGKYYLHRKVNNEFSYIHK